jgi:hypothetical protein
MVQISGVEKEVTGEKNELIIYNWRIDSAGVFRSVVL